MNVSIQMILIEQLEFEFFFNHDHQPAIRIEKTIYTSFSQLFHDFPILSDLRYREKTVQLINFLLKGLEFLYIDHIEQFKQNYLQKIENEDFDLEENRTSLNVYGIFDLSTMHPPTLIDHHLIFFVKEALTTLPYRVSIAFPIHQSQIQASYELLPFLSNQFLYTY